MIRTLKLERINKSRNEHTHSVDEEHQQLCYLKLQGSNVMITKIGLPNKFHHVQDRFHD